MQDIIVVGASAGGVEALKVLAGRFPADLQATVFVVLHIGNGINGHSCLPTILSNAGPLPAVHASDGQDIAKGWIYVAPPDYHLLLAPGHLHLSHGPKESRSRPAINPLFRSAASAYGNRVTGVILTGMLDDGVAGLAEIGRQGGVTIVQDPATALYPDLPSDAIRQVNVHYITPLAEISALLARLSVTERMGTPSEEPVERSLTALSCPDCNGPIWEKRQGSIVEYACRIGHAFAARSMEENYNESVERALWSAILTLEQAADLGERLEPSLESQAALNVKTRREQAAVIREMLNGAAKPT